MWCNSEKLCIVISCMFLCNRDSEKVIWFEAFLEKGAPCKVLQQETTPPTAILPTKRNGTISTTNTYCMYARPIFLQNIITPIPLTNVLGAGLRQTRPIGTTGCCYIAILQCFQPLLRTTNCWWQRKYRNWGAIRVVNSCPDQFVGRIFLVPKRLVPQASNLSEIIESVHTSRWRVWSCWGIFCDQEIGQLETCLPVGGNLERASDMEQKFYEFLCLPFVCVVLQGFSAICRRVEERTAGETIATDNITWRPRVL